MRSSWLSPWRVGLVLVAPLVLYLPSLDSRFLETYDDDRTVLEGVEVHDLRTGAQEHVAMMFDPTVDRRTAGLSAEYLPVRDLGFAIDQWLWGEAPSSGGAWRLNPVGYRLANLLLYGLCGLAFWGVLSRLGVPPAAALAAAILWLVHPLHVENVVWISSRKDVLSGALFLLAILCHLRAGQARARGAAGVLVIMAVALGAAAMLAKATAVVLLPCLVLCDLVRRLPAGARRMGVVQLGSYVLQGAVLAGVLWIHLSVLSAGLGSRPFVQDSDLPLLERGAQAAPNLLVYLRLFAAPLGLSTVREASQVGAGMEWLAVGVLGLLAACAMLSWRRTRGATAGFLWFLGCLVPVANVFVPMPHAMAERYLFLPSLGLAALCGLALHAAWGRWRRLTMALIVLGLLSASVCTLQEAGRWRGDHALWRSVVDQQEGSARAHARLGHAYQLLAVRALAEGREELATRMLDDCLIELRRAIRFEDRDLRAAAGSAGAGRARPPIQVAARVNLASLLIARARAKVDPNSKLALEAVRALGAVVGSVGRSREEVAAAIRDLRGYADARRLLDGAYETWAPTRGILERMLAEEDTSQIAAWRAVTMTDENSWGSCLGVLERENELALERRGVVDSEKLAIESPGYLRVRRAAAYIFLHHPERAPDLIFHLEAEGDALPARYRAALDAARELAARGQRQPAEVALKQVWSAAPQFPEVYIALAELYREAGGEVLAAQHEKAAQALIDARGQ